MPTQVRKPRTGKTPFLSVGVGRSRNAIDLWALARVLL